MSYDPPECRVASNSAYFQDFQDFQGSSKQLCLSPDIQVSRSHVLGGEARTLLLSQDKINFILVCKYFRFNDSPFKGLSNVFASRKIV